MKNKTFFLVAILTILASCITEKTTKRTEYRIIINHSSHLVDLTIVANKQLTIQLDQEDSVIFKGYVISGPGTNYSEIGWSGTEGISGKIVFDKERELVYENESCENGRNPLTPSFWEFLSCGYISKDTDGDGNSEYIYEINDSDYEMAVPIEE